MSSKQVNSSLDEQVQPAFREYRQDQSNGDVELAKSRAGAKLIEHALRDKGYLNDTNTKRWTLRALVNGMQNASMVVAGAFALAWAFTGMTTNSFVYGTTLAAAFLLFFRSVAWSASPEQLDTPLFAGDNSAENNEPIQTTEDTG